MSSEPSILLTCLSCGGGLVRYSAEGEAKISTEFADEVEVAVYQCENGHWTWVTVGTYEPLDGYGYL